MDRTRSSFLPAVIGYFKNIFKRPKVPLTSMQFKSTYWGKIFSIPNITILWVLCKIHPSIEKAIAQKFAKKWYFKPLAMPETLSLKAIEQSKKYSWKNTAKQLFELIKANTNVKSDFDFDKSYNSSAHRTVVTISELVIGLPELLRPEVMEFN